MGIFRLRCRFASNFSFLVFFSTFFRSAKAALAASFLFVTLSNQLGWLLVHFIYIFAGAKEEFFAPYMIHPFLVFYRYLDGLAILLFYNEGKGVKISFDNDAFGGMLGGFREIQGQGVEIS